MSGGASGNTTTVQKSDPWSGQQPYLNDVFSQASDMYHAPSEYPQYYPGSTVASLTPQQTAGINAEFNYGAGGGNPAVNAATGFETNLENGAYLDPTSNPNWQSMAKTVLANTVPGLESQFTQGNAMNSPAAAYAVSQGATDALGGLAAQQYGNTLNLMNSGASWAAPGLQAANLNSIGAMQDAGNQFQTQNQNELTDLVNRYSYNQNLPLNMLDWYNSNIQGSYGGTTALSQPYYKPSALGGALSGALGGAAMGSTVMPGYGTAIGAVAGGLLGAFGNG